MRDGYACHRCDARPDEGGTLQSGFGTDGETAAIGSAFVRRPQTPRGLSALRRANLPVLLNLFDFGDATTAASKRPATTVAPQGLFMMNSDLVTERAQNLAKQFWTIQRSIRPDPFVLFYLRVLNGIGNLSGSGRRLVVCNSFSNRIYRRDGLDGSAASAGFQRVYLSG